MKPKRLAHTTCSAARDILEIVKRINAALPTTQELLENIAAANRAQPTRREFLEMLKNLQTGVQPNDQGEGPAGHAHQTTPKSFMKPKGSKTETPGPVPSTVLFGAPHDLLAQRYHDLEGIAGERICCFCRTPITGGSPWSICFDPMCSVNCWGGDTHEYRGYFCQSCAEGILLQPNDRVEARDKT